MAVPPQPSATTRLPILPRPSTNCWSRGFWSPSHGHPPAWQAGSALLPYLLQPLLLSASIHFLRPPTVVCSIVAFEARCQCREPQAAAPVQTVGIETDCSRAGIPRSASLCLRPLLSITYRPKTFGSRVASPSSVA